MGIRREQLEERLRQLVARDGGRLETEVLCLAALAVGGELVERLKVRQLKDGSWPAAPGVDKGATLGTALAAIALLQLGGNLSLATQAAAWLLQECPREAKWLWRWKLRTVDNKVAFNPAKYGWGWVPGTVSWVVPTSFAIVALEQARPLPGLDALRLRDRVVLGRDMLLDRACPMGGWNAGNGVVCEVAMRPHIDTTATALLALQGCQERGQVQQALHYLAAKTPKCP